MQKNFDELIDSYIENKVGLSDHFLNTTLAQHLKDNLNKLYSTGKLKSAGTGNDMAVVRDKSFRSDVIYWLDRKHNDQYENDFFDLVDSFVSYLNSTCFSGITGYEFHYTLYPEGSFYKKHIDQFQNDNSRKFSMIMYLNDDWINTDGGELCIFHNNDLLKISPKNGKAVFFKSNELEHEVLVTNKPRMSITGWLKC